jgi:nucleoside 2-deoxyribosyltransferase
MRLKSDMEKTVYIAGALFTYAEQKFNLELKERLNEFGFKVILPQEFEGNTESLFEKCISGINKADMVLVIGEGVDVDSGTSFEAGYAYALNKPLFLTRTDFRSRCDDGGLNLMLSKSTIKIGGNNPIDISVCLHKTYYDLFHQSNNWGIYNNES